MSKKNSYLKDILKLLNIQKYYKNTIKNFLSIFFISNSQFYSLILEFY